MQMDAGLDTGDMLLVEKPPIAPTDTTAVLHDRLADLGGRMIVEALELAACGGLQPRAAACRGRDLRAQDREGRERDRLVVASRMSLASAFAPSIPSRAPAPRCKARRSRCGAMKLIAASAYPMSAAGRFWHQAQRA